VRIALLAIVALLGCSKREAPRQLDGRPRPTQLAPAPAPAPARPPEKKVTLMPARYPFDRTHSPIDVSVVARLRAIAGENPGLRADAFAKVGDSITASTDFLHCFQSPAKTVLGEHSALASVIERFRATGSFDRASDAARIGWSAWKVVVGSPSPLEREIAANEPRFALVQYGTNDIQLGQIHRFADNLFEIVDRLGARGTIPILFTIPARRDSAEANLWVPRYNAVIRGIAQARQVPLVDYHRELSSRPNSGLAKDGIHPSTFQGKHGRNACALEPRGLEHGYNLRNLLALQALDRALRALEGETLDPPASASDDARTVTRLPFIDAPSFASGATAEAAGCGSEPSRPRVEYRLRLEHAVSLRATGFDRRGEVDLLLETGGTCKRAARAIQARLAPGEHRIVLEAGSPDAETLLVLLAE
jgi:hypothetical protein